MTANRNPVVLPDALTNWISEVTGGSVVLADRRPGGGRREAWIVDVKTPAGELLPLFLRYDALDPEQRGDGFTLHREAAFFRALADSGVPIPETLGVHPTAQAILSRRVPGEAFFAKMTDEAERISVASDFMRILARMHAIDPHRLRVDDQDPDADLRDLVHREIDTWERIYRDAGGRDPLIDLALGWVRGNVPDVSGPVVIVQGDTGPGNFLYENGKVTAVLDLELGHLGDPHDDLAWVTTRATQDPFTSMTDRFADYSAAAGRPIDPGRVRYYRVLAELRIVILGHGNATHRDLLAEVGNSLAFGLLHRRLLIEALADVLGVDIEPVADVDVAGTDREWLFDAALAQIRQIIVPRSEDPFVIQRSKGLARILKHLREADRFDGAIEARNLADLEGILGERPASVAAGTEVLVDRHLAGELLVTDVLRIFSRQIAGLTQTLRPAMGVLADRHFDPID
ncbi:phosphotransferase family protein [Nocardia jiangxiensis]|uniref:Phosphotransferase family protein n=1 Tax=Nocardia jiangxiensis TaxID=282685 RepID=A0ABW6SAF1_9NOCA|nr:phosphotransferase family protein [Nocardia jiangxiensis]